MKRYGVRPAIYSQELCSHRSRCHICLATCDGGMAAADWLRNRFHAVGLQGLCNNPTESTSSI